ncbi:ATP synthase protein I [Andreprevotia lacus DSM 23236]|jgi:ATP synthase protein I|uniref:ATP synthase protein I n=1 Tax=Andreprevotia lacus DSM 23236 TaxID=1121001 RepID=A0A1W1XBI0_9NEIS|nr:ATP synthase subunit I [Andreprevotia lacus]SMC21227.1 ATP synthase protein I [Andreprevotia lacus DSM 23236]
MSSRAQVRGIVVLGAIITLAVSVLVLLLWGRAPAIASAIGGAISVAGAQLYARIAYRMEFGPPAALMRQHFAAEMFKLSFTLAAFAAVFVFYRQVVWLALFGGYLAAASAYWFGLLFKFDGKK